MPAPSDALDASLCELVALFSGPLAHVTFPGVDNRRLTSLATQVEADAAELARLDAAATALRQRLADARDDLLQRAFPRHARPARQRLSREQQAASRRRGRKAALK